jgi:molybdopterin/thiamine biosynthesis adenylyltransferase
MAKKSVDELLQTYTQQRTRPDESTYNALLFSGEKEIARQTGLSLKQVQCLALQAGILPERYSRNQKSLSMDDQLRLLCSQAAVIGLGGLGGSVTEILARIGVGSLTLVDGDCFDESNLNRQLLSSTALIGQSKALAAKSRVAAINPAVEVQAIEQFFTADNSQAILRGASVAVDCLDTISDRFILEDGCRKQGIPLISAAIGGCSGQATLIYPGGAGLKRIYGEPGRAPARGVEASMGTLPFAAMYMAAVECAEAVTILLGKQGELCDRLFFADVSDHTTELFILPDESASDTRED